MSTGSTRLQENSVLGESWVVTTSKSSSQEEDTVSPDNQERRDPSSPTSQKFDDLSASITSAVSSSSVISGPELIMPSICDEPISEASWVAPKMRSSRRRSSRSSQSQSQSKRKSVSFSDILQVQEQDQGQDDQKKKTETETEKPSEAAAAGPPPSSPPTAAARAQGMKGQLLKYLSTTTIFQNPETEKLLRTAVSFFLLLPILHILVLPELFYQYPSLCSMLPSAAALYPTSCSTLRKLNFINPHATRIIPSRYESILTSHRQLETLLNSTMQDLAPLTSTNPFKHSESALRDLHAQLKTTYPEAKHELDLEFEGAWAAARTASRDFDALKAELSSSVDSLAAQGARIMNAKQSGKREDKDKTTPNDGENKSHLSRILSRRDPAGMDKSKSTPFQITITRHAELLDKATTQLRSKADSLLRRIATLEDHLESIEEIVSREAQRATTTTTPGSSSGSGSGSGSDSSVSRLFSSLPGPLRQLLPGPDGSSSSSSSKEKEHGSLASSLRQAGSHHRAVRDVVRKLEGELQAVQVQVVQGRR